MLHPSECCFRPVRLLMLGVGLAQQNKQDGMQMAVFIVFSAALQIFRFLLSYYARQVRDPMERVASDSVQSPSLLSVALMQVDRMGVNPGVSNEQIVNFCVGVFYMVFFRRCPMNC